MHSCCLICVHKENANGYDIKGNTFDDYLAVLVSGRISVYSFVLLICHDLDSLPDINRFTQGADKSLARPTSRCILFDGENISFDANLLIYIYITNIPPITIINRIY